MKLINRTQRGETRQGDSNFGFGARPVFGGKNGNGPIEPEKPILPHLMSAAGLLKI